MVNNDLLQMILNQYQIEISGAPILNAEQPDHIYLYVHVKRNSANRQVPSNTKLHAAKKSFIEQGVTVDFLLFDDSMRDTEAGLRATLLHAFGGDIRNVFLSIDGKIAHVWVDPKRQLNDAIKRDMSQKAIAFLSQLDLELGVLASVVGENLPGTLALLKAVRQVAPVNATELKSYLLGRGFIVPSEDWTMRRLDTIRKAGRLVRLKNGKYVLSLRCIKELGTEKNKRSPDIARLLALNVKSRYST